MLFALLIWFIWFIWFISYVTNIVADKHASKQLGQTGQDTENFTHNASLISNVYLHLVSLGLIRKETTEFQLDYLASSIFLILRIPIEFDYSQERSHEH